MTLGEALGAGMGAVGTLVDCALGLARRLNAPFTARLGSPDPPLEPRPMRPAPPGGGLQTEVEEAKYYLGHSPEPLRTLTSDGPLPDREPGDLPHIYGRDTLVLLPRDPWWVFAYWEVTPATREQALRRLGNEADGARDVLRVHDVTFLTFTGDNAWFSFDLELVPSADHWYLNVPRPGASYLAEVGLRTRSGGFLSLVRSSAVTTARAAPSPDTALRWVELRRDGKPRETAGPDLPADADTVGAPSPGPLDVGPSGSSDAWAPPPR
jgi:hypothetical protein